MDWLQIIANLAQILGVIWAIVCGGKTIFDIISSLRRVRPIRIRPLVMLNFLVACIVVLLIGILVRPSLIPFGPSSPVATPGLTSSSTSTSSGNTSVVGTTGSSSPSPTLKPLLQQSIPMCNNPADTIWSTPLPQTIATCVSNGLQVQQQGKNYYAEVDLDDVKGTSYNQTTFSVQVQLTCQNSGDVQTSAGLIVQTPQAQGVAGGYIFSLNCTGNWILQQVQSGSTIPTVQNGTVSIDEARPITLKISVQNGLLNGFINQQQVITNYSDSFSSAEALAVGLIVEHPGGPSSPVLFSNFEIDA